MKRIVFNYRDFLLAYATLIAIVAIIFTPRAKSQEYVPPPTTDVKIYDSARVPGTNSLVKVLGRNSQTCWVLYEWDSSYARYYAVNISCVKV